MMPIILIMAMTMIMTMIKDPGNGLKSIRGSWREHVDRALKSFERNVFELRLLNLKLLSLKKHGKEKDKKCDWTLTTFIMGLI